MYSNDVTAWKLSVRDVLGLSDPGHGEWSRLRGFQFSSLARRAHYHPLLQMIYATLTLYLYHQEIHAVLLGIWFAALAYVLIRGWRIDVSLFDTDRRRITRDEVYRHAVNSIYAAVLWTIPLVGFAPLGTELDQMTLFVCMAMSCVGPALFQTASPLGAVLFNMVAGFAAILGLVFMGQIELAIVTGGFIGMSVTGTLETARNQLYQKLYQEGMAEKAQVVSLLLKEFEENEADWLWQVDTNRRVRSVSPRFAFALGLEQQDANGKLLIELIAGKNWETGDFPSSLHDLAERLKNRENFSNLMVQVSIKGEQRWWELSGTPMRDEHGNFIGFRGVGSDVTAQRESSDKIAYLARYDTLTSLPNRLQLTEALGDALQYADQWRGKCALLMVDLDRFKSVNDSLGHMVGDKLLAQVSSRLQSLMGEGQMCGRLGGDEFAIVITDASDSTATAKLAMRVIEHLSEPYMVDNHTLYVGASVGSAVGPRDGRTVEELMRNADLALYRAKDEGGGSHFNFEPSLHAFAEERRKLEVSLRSALQRDEFILHYQPVVDANNDKIVSFEALVRWQSAEHGFISPAKFVPIAEDTRLIVPIGKWVLRRACEEARNWPDHVKVNVNVSPEQLLEPDFTDEVVAALAASGLAPQRLEIEVTESIFLRDASVARGALEQVMALGCSVALDDFGTGYSSLGYLRKLQFSTIKVDRTFVKGAAQNSAESLAIIRAVVAMAQSLNMTTTAEGAETEEEVALIRELGCDKIQGFYFGRPMAAADALRLFSAEERRRA